MSESLSANATTLYSQLNHLTASELVGKENVGRLFAILMVDDLSGSNSFVSTEFIQGYILNLCVTLQSHTPKALDDLPLSNVIYSHQTPGSTTIDFDYNGGGITKEFDLSNATEAEIEVSIKRIFQLGDFLSEPYSIGYMLQLFFNSCTIYDAQTNTFSLDEAQSELFFRRFYKIIVS